MGDGRQYDTITQDLKNMQKLNIRTSCRICKSKNLLQILNLGATPLADNFVTDTKAKEMEFPLNVVVCKKCFLVQLVDEVDSSLLFGNNDYGFFTGGSPASIKYFRDYAEKLIKDYPKQCEKLILEIASNDGTLLNNFKINNYNVQGIDPAKNVAKSANQAGIPTIIDFFNKKTAIKYFSDKKASLIIANNVVAHVDDIHDFMEGVDFALEPNGVFVFECQYLPYLIFNNQFDNVYHEHRAFLSLIPLLYLLNNKNLEIFDVEEYDTQGGSIRVYVSHKGACKKTDKFIKLQDEEYQLGLDKIETYLGINQRAQYIKIRLNKILSELKAAGKTVYGYGASAKSNTLLNYCGIGTDLLDLIVDKTPYKYGKYTPGTHIPIVDQDTINNPDYYLLLVWNYASHILKKEKKYRENGGKFIIPISTPYIL